MDTTPLTDDDLLLGRYRPVAVLGHGGMASVYEAVDERLARNVAVKVVHSGDPTSTARSRAEATVLARLRHPNLVTVYDVGVHDGRPFVVTELIRGRTLRDRMDGGPIPANEAARIGSAVASALACAHDHGVVHRDVTPGNIVLTEGSGDARLIDFGIATSPDALALTATGLVIGTPAYLSPEQVEGSSATSASDVYALGIVLLEALTGQRVFPGTITEASAARLVGDAPVPAGLAPGWRPILRAMTRREPGCRPAASAVAEHLTALARGRAAPWTPPGAGTPTVATVAGTRTRERATTATTIATTTATSAPTGRAAALRRRWPFVMACLALLSGLTLLLAFSDRATDGPVPGVDPTVQIGGPVDRFTSPTPSTVADTTTPPSTDGGAAATPDRVAGTGGRGQAKAKGRDG